jgi:hypothetical protein
MVDDERIAHLVSIANDDTRTWEAANRAEEAREELQTLLEKKSHGLGAMMAGGNSAEGRQEDDFYATPPEATQSLYAAYGAHLPHLITEPCCGDGAISKVLVQNGHTVYSTDLVDRGYGLQADIFSVGTGSSCVITNPPFNIAEEIVRHVLGRWKSEILILLLKSTFFHADDRAANLFNEFRPSRVYMLPWRLDFLGKGRPTMECSWFIWDKNNPTTDGFPSYRVAPNYNSKKRKTRARQHSGLPIHIDR